jgi:hypothetical protein
LENDGFEGGENMSTTCIQESMVMQINEAKPPPVDKRPGSQRSAAKRSMIESAEGDEEVQAKKNYQKHNETPTASAAPATALLKEAEGSVEKFNLVFLWS